MQKLEIYLDHNFLGGDLHIVVEDNTITGQLVIDYNDCCDCGCYDEIKAQAVCHPDDTFDVNKGIDIVKSKIVKKYYSRQKRLIQQRLKDIERERTDLINMYNRATRKVENVAKDMSRMYGIDTYGFKADPIKKVTKEPTTTKTKKATVKKK